MRLSQPTSAEIKMSLPGLLGWEEKSGICRWRWNLMNFPGEPQHYRVLLCGLATDVAKLHEQ